MFDEPHRWLQSVENRIQYVEGRLKKGSPTIGLPYESGALLFTLSPRGQQKIYEVYDRLALAAMGHPADVERLRMMVIDLAHTEGFARSADDVTLQRLLNFGVAPQIKNAFDEIYRAPFIVKLLMVELTANGGEPQFFTVNFDGNFVTRKNFGVAAGTPEAEDCMAASLSENVPASNTLADVLKSALHAWAVGYHISTQLSEYDDPPMPEKSALNQSLKGALENLSFEAAVLDTKIPGKAKFRHLRDEELAGLDTDL